MMFHPRLGGGPRVAFGGLLIAAGLFGWSAWRAVDISDVRALQTDDASTRTPSLPERESSEVQTVLAAVEIDPFHPERRRPRQRFRLPGERRPTRAAPRTGIPEITLTGTMVYPGGGGVAMVRLAGGGQSTQMVRVGEAIANLTLESVTREQAVFVTAGGRRVVIGVEGRSP